MDTEKKRLKLEYIDPRLLVPNTWNSNEMTYENELKLRASLERNDMVDAIVARKKSNGDIEILSGEHRTKVSIQIGMKEIPVFILENISDSRAKEIGLTLNSRYGYDDNLKLSELLNSMEDVDILHAIIPITVEEIDMMLSA